MSESKSWAPTPGLVVSLIHYFLPLIVLAVTLYFIPELYHLVSMLFIAILFSYLLRPPVELLEHRGFSRYTATALVFVVLFLILVTLLGGFIPHIYNQAINLRRTLGQLEIEELLEEEDPGEVEEVLGFMSYLSELERSLGFIPDGTLHDQVSHAYEWGLQQLTILLLTIGRILPHVAVYVVVIPFIAFFIVRDQQAIETFFLSGVPNVFFEMFYLIYNKVDQKIGEYVRGLAIEAIIIALLSAVGFWLLDVPYAVTIGIFVGLANVVPYVGPVIGALPAIIVQLIETGAALPVFLVIVLIGIVQLIDNITVKPVAFSQSMSMHPLIVVIVIIAGGQLAGMLGMVLAIPVAASLWVIISEFSWAVKNYRFET